jgi:UDP-N-acetylmuramyl pentapeptide phosphotransferase/UDP-N-acetylglucosamine-1-phosphate transferase
MTQNNAFVLGLAMFSFMMTVIWGTPLLRVLRHFKVGKIIRVEEPDRHRIKMGTPTMGGILFIIPVVLLTGLLNAASFIGFEAHRQFGARAFDRDGELRCARRIGRLGGYPRKTPW